MTLLNKSIVSLVFLSLATLVAVADGAQVAFVEDPEIAVPNKVEPEVDGSIFASRTPEEYRSAILNATNEAQIDAFICQQMVQEKREAGEDLTDYEFNEYLDTREVKIERQRRVQEWMKEREKAKANATKPNLVKMIAVLGAIVVVLLIVMAIGGGSKPKQGSPEKQE